jgi:hypothetical protein
VGKSEPMCLTLLTLHQIDGWFRCVFDRHMRVDTISIACRTTQPLNSGNLKPHLARSRSGVDVLDARLCQSIYCLLFTRLRSMGDR